MNGTGDIKVNLRFMDGKGQIKIHLRFMDGTGQIKIHLRFMDGTGQIKIHLGFMKTDRKRIKQVPEESSRDENDSKGKSWSIRINNPSEMKRCNATYRNWLSQK